jgi:hypothetical protein
MPAAKSTTKKSTASKAKKSTKSTSSSNSKKETYKAKGNEVVEKVKEIINEGNARKIIIRNEKGNSIMELPLTVGVVGTLLAPYLTAVGAIAAVVTSCTIEVEKNK